MGWPRGRVAFLHDGGMVHVSRLPLSSGSMSPHTGWVYVLILGWFFRGEGECLKSMKLLFACVDFLSIANVLFPITCRRLLGG